jgi:hypothetical protein
MNEGVKQIDNRNSEHKYSFIEVCLFFGGRLDTDVYAASTGEKTVMRTKEKSFKNVS